jgi:LuxR family maltose regulon positive regulatory protein
MAGRQRHTPDLGVAFREDSFGGLLAAKMTPPWTPPDFVLRQRLIDRLDVGTGGEVTLIVAGPGSGKTSLTAAWTAAGHSPGPVAWLSLDAYDNSPTRFWSYLLGALRGTGLFPEDGSRDLLVPGRHVDEAFVRGIANQLARLAEPVVLVLDDMQEISNPAILKLLGFLLRHRIPQFRSVIITRAEQSFLLRRSRTRNGVLEIRSAELAFNVDETTALLDQKGLRLTSDQLRVLVEQAEGWATALCLASTLMTERGTAAGLAQFNGAEPSVAEYLRSELLAELPADLPRFLQRTCVVDEVSGGLTNALTGETDGHENLERLAMSNALVTRLEVPPGCFRYHRLLVELLRYELLKTPQIARTLHLRAAGWFATRDARLTAIGHAVAAADWSLVGRLVVTKAAARMLSVDRRVLVELLARIPAEQHSATARMQICSALLAYDAKDYDAVVSRVASARALLLEEDADLRRPIEITARLLDASLARDHGDMAALVEAMDEVLKDLAEVPLAELSYISEYRAVAFSNAGVGLLWMGRLARAERYFRSGIAVARAAGEEMPQINAMSHLALLQASQGNLQEAGDHAANSLELATRRGWNSIQQVVPAHVALALVSLEQNTLDVADAELEAGLAAQRSDPEPIQYFAVRLAQARVLLARGQTDRARLLGEDIKQEFSAERMPPTLARWLALLEAEIALVERRPNDVLRGMDNADDIVRASPRMRNSAVRAHLMLGNRDAAERMLAAPGSMALDLGSAVETWVVTALLADSGRQTERSVEAMARAVALAEPENLRRPFVGLDRAWIAVLLERCQAMSPQRSSFAADLLTGRRSDVSVTDSPELPEQLTERELDVLRYLPSTLRNQDIAGEMFLSVNTVKAHLRSIYGKLGATHRREAVQRARELGLL